jgi:hypothetical protein
LILAMDLGWSKSAIRILETRAGLVRASAGRRDAARIRTPLERHPPDRVVVEISPLAAMVHDAAVGLGLGIQVRRAESKT